MLDSLLESSDALILLARVLLMTLFLITGWQKLTNFPGTVAYMKTTDAPAPELSAVIAIVVEFFTSPWPYLSAVPSPTKSLSTTTFPASARCPVHTPESIIAMPMPLPVNPGSPATPAHT